MEMLYADESLLYVLVNVLKFIIQKNSKYKH